MADIRSRKQKVAAPKAWHDARALCNFSRLFVWLAVWFTIVDTRDGAATRDRFQIRKDFHVVILIHEPDASQLLVELEAWSLAPRPTYRVGVPPNEFTFCVYSRVVQDTQLIKVCICK
jgi:hypothetical protein